MAWPARGAWPWLLTPSGYKGPPPPGPGCSPESRPSWISLSMPQEPTWTNRQTDRWTDGEPHLPSFLPSSVHFFFLVSGVGPELPTAVTKPVTRCPPRFAAMTFNTSGMIRNLRTDRGWLCWAPGLGSWARLPAGVPDRLGAAGGEVGPDRQVGGGGQPGRLPELPEWRSSGPRRGWRGLEGWCAWPGSRRAGSRGCRAYERAGRAGRRQGGP